MRKMIVILLVVLAVMVTGQAQVVGDLQEPDIDVYLQAIKGIVERADEEAIPPNGYPYHTARIRATIEDELWWRYGEFSDASPNNIYSAFLAMSRPSKMNPFPNLNYYAEGIILSLVENHEGDWASINDTYQLADFELTVTPRDYNADGQDELLVVVSNYYYNKHHVLEATEDGYRIVRSPVSVTGCCYSYWDSRSGFYEEQYFGDMTGDGVPEWVLAFGGVGGGHMNHGSIVILQWQDGELVRITPPRSFDDPSLNMSYSSPAGGGSPLFPYGVRVENENRDDDETLEVVIYQDFTDSWGCEFASARVFAWTGENFELSIDEREFAESASCATRNARNLSWAGNIDAAIPYYELALEHFEVGVSEYLRGTISQAYVSVHLALIEAIRGDINSAQIRLGELDADNSVEPIDALVEATQDTLEVSQNPFDLCVAMFDVFEMYHDDTLFPNPYWGHTDDVQGHYGGGNASAPYPDTSKAGCDSAYYLDVILGDSGLVLSDDPSEQLNDLGIYFDEILNFDLNQDERDEYLIIFESSEFPALYLSPKGDSYEYQSVDVGVVNGFTSFYEVRLQDDGVIVAQHYFDNQSPNDEVNPNGITDAPCIVDDESYSAGFVYFWHLNDGVLEHIQSMLICDRSLIEVFESQAIISEIDVWRRVYEDGSDSLVPITLVWDSEEGRFIEPQIPVGGLAALEIAEPQSIVQLFVSGEYEKVLAFRIPDTSPRSNDGNLVSDYPMSYQTMHLYYQAMALEALNRQDEALEMYMTIYEADPESAWGQLAALHLSDLFE